MLNHIDIRNVFILVLLVVLVFVFLRKESIGIDYKNEEINYLKKQNSFLMSKNDSLGLQNLRLDGLLKDLEIKIVENKNKLSDAQKEIERLKNIKNEIPAYINTLSANDVADALTKHIDRKK
jgi:hypothetical protein